MEQPSQAKKGVERWGVWGVLLMAAVLLFFRLGERALWWDEIINVYIDQQSVRGILTSLGAIPGAPTYVDVHPPLFHLIQHYWLILAGDSDFAVRFPNAVFALLALYWLYHIGRKVGGPVYGLVAMLVIALSPFWLMYARMARYYALTTMLGLASTFFYLELLESPTRTRWGIYGVVNMLLLYTDYLAAILLVCQCLYLLFIHPDKRWVRTWFLSMICVGVIYLPWLPAWYRQTHMMHGLIEADLAHSFLGTVFKFAFPLLSFTTGETMFPWELPALIGYVLCAGLLIYGIRALLRQSSSLSWHGSRLSFVLLFTLLPVLGTIAVITFITPTITFIGIGNRTFFAFPFLGLLLASGLCALKRPRITIFVAILLVSIWGYGSYNYYVGRNFFNPVYAVPTEQVVADVLTQAQPGDVIFSDVDMGFGYYFDKQTHAEVSHYFFGSQEASEVLDQIRQDLASGHSPTHKRVFILIMGRDRTRRELPRELMLLLQPPTRLLWEQGYVRQDETYRQVKRMLLGREDYQYKLLVQLYELSQ
ncbi:MAG TPA: glycosyltransferase family 39 protein [Anaerolineae bacterium]|nr:glycosyltransferase family 39 protein [Anaerolineae bacterium]HQH37893.1 glycosyltransferase family 39 protein [Anaerolineae bacterium]